MASKLLHDLSASHVFPALGLDVCPEVPPWAMPHSPSELRPAHWTAWEPGKVGIDCLLQIFFALFPLCSCDNSFFLKLFYLHSERHFNCLG